ncbi:MAG: molybdopterin-dependent oxidoreductase [Acidimicrobiales bacterium]
MARSSLEGKTPRGTQELAVSGDQAAAPAGAKAPARAAAETVATNAAGPPPPSGAGAGAGVTGSPIGRRVLLSMMGLGAVGILAGARIQNAMNAVLAPLQALDPTGLTQLLPAAGGFRIYSVTGSLPSESDKAYKLTVDGLVNTPMTFTLADLRSMPATSVVSDFQCVTGWRVPAVHWTGVKLSAILDAAGVRPGGSALLFESFDGEYSESLTMPQALRPDVLVAYDMLGSPVTRDHGGPVRLFVSPMYGYKSCKWLSRISVVNHVIPGYWEQLGYDIDAWVGHSNGRSDSPTV